MRSNLHHWFFMVIALTALIAQTPNKNSPEVATHDATPTFSTRSNLVVVHVVVRDKEGHTNGSLRKEDFQVFDKGKPQFISKFTMEKAAGRTADTSTGQRSDQRQPADPLPPERYVAYLFDDVHISFADLARAREAASKHLTAAILASSRAAIFTTSGQTTLDFTDDLSKLRETLLRILPRPIAGHSHSDCPNLSFYQADLIYNKEDPAALQAAIRATIACSRLGGSEGSALVRAAAARMVSVGDVETRLALTVLRDVQRRMRTLPGQRSIILVSPGFYLLEQHRFDEIDIMDRAIRANMTISALDGRGLYTLDGDATRPDAPSHWDRDAALYQGDVLAELADGTGGSFVHDTNDLAGGFDRIDTPPAFYYVLGFSPQNLKFDGTYHSLKVTLGKTLKGFKVQARPGYYAPRHEENAGQTAKREVEEAVFSRDELHDIPASLQTQFFKSSDAKAKLSVVARVDVKALSYREVEGRHVNTLTVVSGIFDRNGNFIDAIEKTIDMRLTDETLAHRLAPGMIIKTAFDVTPGGYFVRLVVRDVEAQKMTALNGAVEIP